MFVHTCRSAKEIFLKVALKRASKWEGTSVKLSAESPTPHTTQASVQMIPSFSEKAPPPTANVVHPIPVSVSGTRTGVQAGGLDGMGIGHGRNIPHTYQQQQLSQIQVQQIQVQQQQAQQQMQQQAQQQMQQQAQQQMQQQTQQQMQQQMQQQLQQQISPQHLQQQIQQQISPQQLHLQQQAQRDAVHYQVHMLKLNPKNLFILLFPKSRLHRQILLSPLSLAHQQEPICHSMPLLSPCLSKVGSLTASHIIPVCKKKPLPQGQGYEVVHLTFICDSLFLKHGMK